MTSLAPPKVSVLISTYNRPRYLAEAVDSVIRQTRRDWELIIINDGGRDVAAVVEAFNEPRIRYIHDPVNRGAARRFNQGLSLARGEYIAYLGDDDRFYPNHLAVLAAALDEHPEIGLVYSDLYGVSCLIDPQTGDRHVMDKRLSVSRDFNREFMFHHNHILHVSLMHRREAALRVGGFDESVKVLIEWSLNRRLSFIYDFMHVEQITGEYYMPLFKSDRISVRERRDKNSYRHNLRLIKAGLPPLPWPKVRQVATIYPVERWGEETNRRIGALMDHFDHPFHLLLINNGSGLPEAEARKSLGPLADLKNLAIINSARPLPPMLAYRLAAKRSSADFLFLVTDNLQAEKMPKRLFASLDFLASNPQTKALKWEVEEERQTPFDCLIRKDYFLRHSRPGKPNAVDMQSVELRLPKGFKFDAMYSDFQKKRGEGRLGEARKILELILQMPSGAPRIQFVMHDLAKICLALKDYQTVEREARRLIQRGYRPDNLIWLGLALNRQGRWPEAVEAFTEALKEFYLTEKSFEAECFPINFPKDMGVFKIFIGLGEACLGLGDCGLAAKYYHLAAKTRANSHKPFLGFAKLYLAAGQIDRAETALNRLPGREGEKDPETHRLLAKLCQRRQRLDLSFTCMLKAFECAPGDENNVDPFYFAGAALGRWEEMAPVLDRFLAENPDDLKGLARQAAVLTQLERRAEAWNLIQRGLALRPGHPVLRSLADRLEKDKNKWAGPPPGLTAAAASAGPAGGLSLAWPDFDEPAP